MLLLKDLLLSVVLATAVSAAVSSIGLLWRNVRAPRVVAPLALGLAYSAGHLLLTGWLRFPPVDTINWLPYFAIGAAVAAACCGLATISPKARLLVHAVVCICALRLLLAPGFRHGWSFWEGWTWVVSLTSAIILLAILLDLLRRRASTAGELPLLMLIVTAGASVALILSGSMLLGHLAAALAAGVVGTLLLHTAKSPAGGGEIIPVISLLLIALLVSGYFFAELPATSAGLLVAAPALALVPIRTESLRSSAFRVTVVALPTAAALIFAFRASPRLIF